jgi:hypothetical protein
MKSKGNKWILAIGFSKRYGFLQVPIGRNQKRYQGEN